MLRYAVNKVDQLHGFKLLSEKLTFCYQISPDTLKMHSTEMEKSCNFPNTSYFTDVRATSVDEVVTIQDFPELWSTHITEADMLLMERWTLESEVFPAALARKSSPSTLSNRSHPSTVSRGPSISASSQSVSGASRKRKGQFEDQPVDCPPTKRYHHQTRAPGYTRYPPVDRYHWTPASRDQSTSTNRPLSQQARVYVNPHHASYNYMVASKRY